MTQAISIKVQPRSIKGNDVRKLRTTLNVVPGVIYGHGINHVLLQIPYNEFVQLYKAAGNTHIVDVEIEEKIHHCLIQDIDVDPVKGTARHVDFYVVDLKQKVVVEVPLLFVGVSEAVTQGAVLSENIKSVSVEALPNEVPENIVVDLTHLKTMQDVIFIKDLPVTKKYIITDDGELVVATVSEAKEEPENVVTTENVVAETTKVETKE